MLSNLRKFILNSMINGKIKFYCSENEIVPYEENKVYIPEKFRNYIRTLIIGEGAGVVGIANSRNEIINDLNDVDVIVADILSEPKTEKEIIEKLSKTAIYRTMPDGERKEVFRLFFKKIKLVQISDRRNIYLSLFLHSYLYNFLFK